MCEQPFDQSNEQISEFTSANIDLQIQRSCRAITELTAIKFEGFAHWCDEDLFDLTVKLTKLRTFDLNCKNYVLGYKTYLKIIEMAHGSTC